MNKNINHHFELSYMDGNQFTLESFLKENQHLFIIFGIFGSLSVYFTSLLDKYTDYPFLRLGIASSLALFAMVSIIILKNTFKDENKKFIIDFLTADDENIYRLAFIIPFFLLSLTIISFIYVRFEQEISAMGVMFSYWIGVITYTPILKRYVEKQTTLFLISIIMFFILAIIIIPLEDNLNTLSTLSSFTLSFLKGIALPASMCMLLIPVAYMYKKIR